MARRSSFFVSLERVARAAARAQREAEAQRRRQVRDQLRHERDSLRLRQQHSKFERQQYLASREIEATKLNIELETELIAIRGVLSSRQNLPQQLVMDSMMPKHEPPALKVPTDLANATAPPVRSTFVAGVRPVAWWEQLFRRTDRFAKETADAEAAFRAAMQQHDERETAREAKLDALRRERQELLKAYAAGYSAQRKDIEEFFEKFRATEPEVVCAYYNVILDRSPYPDGFPQEFRTAYDPSARQLVIDYELPAVQIVPMIGEFRYIKSKDVIEEKPRKAAEIKELYREVIAAVCLRCLHECFSADGSGVLSIVTFNGFVNTVDPATGNQVRPYVISIRTTRERFSEIILDRVDTKACLRNLGAQVSPQPSELIAVKPIIEFDMVDKRFIGERDVLSEIDSRPNLMDLTPAVMGRDFPPHSEPIFPH